MSRFNFESTNFDNIVSFNHYRQWFNFRRINLGFFSSVNHPSFAWIRLSVSDDDFARINQILSVPKMIPIHVPISIWSRLLAISIWLKEYWDICSASWIKYHSSSSRAIIIDCCRKGIIEKLKRVERASVLFLCWLLHLFCLLKNYII